MSTTESAQTYPVAGPREIAPNCFLVSGRHPEWLLQCNTYVRRFEVGSKVKNVCIDPGSQLDQLAVAGNVNELAGSLGEISAFTLNHQDPDVVGNSSLLCDANPRIKAIVSEDVWRLVRHLGFRPGSVDFVNPAQSNRVCDGALQVVPTPFCHFRGAMAFYDPEIRTLFTGDLLGGMNQLGRVHLFAEDEDWIGIAQFQQIYMPSRDILRYALRQIRSLNPAVEIIAPQHGHVITGDLVPTFLERLENLLVGYDLLSVELDDTYLARYGRIVGQVADWASEVMGRAEVCGRLAAGETDADGLARQLSVSGEDIVLQREGYSALSKVFSRLAASEPAEFVNALRSVVLALCSHQEVPIPPLGVGLEEGGMP